MVSGPYRLCAVTLGATVEMTLPALYTDCLNAFRKFLIECSKNSRLAHSNGLEKSLDEYSRLKIWGDERRASLPSSVPGSLSDVLQDQPELCQTVIEVFQSIIDSLHEGVSHAYALHLKLLADYPVIPLLPNCSEDTFSFGGGIDWDSDESSDEDSQTSNSPRESEIPRILDHVFQNVKILYSLSSLLRRPRLEGRYLPSSKPGDDVSFHQQDYQHIRQKLSMWQNQQREENRDEPLSPESASPAVPKEEETAAPGDITARQDREEASTQLEFVLSRRIATANMKRRVQFRYWEAHPYK